MSTWAASQAPCRRSPREAHGFERIAVTWLNVPSPTEFADSPSGTVSNPASRLASGSP